MAKQASEQWKCEVDAAQLERWISEHAPGVESPDPGIALAWALFHRRPEALAAFERSVAPKVSAALRKLGANDAAISEHLQHARTRLLVDDGGARLKSYRGLGTFESFVTTIAVRNFASAHRERPEHGSDEVLVGVAASDDLEKALSRSGQSEHFATAFREALAALSDRERALLRLNLVDGASIDELAPMYNVSRATVARWLASAKQSLQAGTLSLLSKRTRLEGQELDHLMASLQSGFDVSLRRFVADAAPSAESKP